MPQSFCWPSSIVSPCRGAAGCAFSLVPLASCAEQLDLQYAFITAILTVLLSYLQLVGGDPSSILSALVAVGQEI